MFHTSFFKEVCLGESHLRGILQLLQFMQPEFLISHENHVVTNEELCRFPRRRQLLLTISNFAYCYGWDFF